MSIRIATTLAAVAAASTLAAAPASAAPAAEASPTQQAAAGQVGVITWNVNYGRGPAAVKADWAKIATKGDVFLLQETKNVRISDVVDTRTFGVVQTYPRKGAAQAGSTVVYRKSAFTKTFADLVKAVDGKACKVSMQTRYINRVNLRHTATGRTLAVGSAHMPVQACGAAARSAMVDRVVRMAKNTSNPLVLGGDWNTDMRTANPLGIPKRTGFAKRAFAAGGEKTKRDGFFVKASLSPSAGSLAASTGSDHNPVKTVVTLR